MSDTLRSDVVSVYSVENVGKLIRENARLRRAVSALYEWYDKDGSVGMASVVFEEHRSALRDTEAK